MVIDMLILNISSYLFDILYSFVMEIINRLNLSTSGHCFTLYIALSDCSRGQNDSLTKTCFKGMWRAINLSLNLEISEGLVVGGIIIILQVLK